MKIGILCAGDEELAPFLPLISNCKITEKAMLKFHAGQIDSVEVVALFSGVCKVNAAIAAQLLIDVFCVDIIINSGTAGRMVTGESFITDESRQKINDEFAPLTVDMETASIAHVCYANDIPFIAIRCVTDTEKHSGVDNFDGNCAKASSIAKDITVALLREIKKSW